MAGGVTSESNSNDHQQLLFQLLIHEERHCGVGEKMFDGNFERYLLVVRFCLQNKRCKKKWQSFQLEVLLPEI
jgi:hypothetical protein